MVVGGVVGGVAGIALVALALMFLLRWRKQQADTIKLLGDSDGARSMFNRITPSGGSGGTGMTQRTMSATSTLASLTRKPLQLEGPPAGERSFHRISGRKLKPVLLTGGDGFSDPDDEEEDNRLSGVSYYRDSIAIFGGPSTPLQLGSPMRPESGIMFMRSGPARTPVQEQNPFSDDNRPVTPFTPPGHTRQSMGPAQVFNAQRTSRYTEHL
jgi:hypothetical protein